MTRCTAEMTGLRTKAAQGLTPCNTLITCQRANVTAQYKAPGAQAARLAACSCVRLNPPPPPAAWLRKRKGGGGTTRQAAVEVGRHSHEACGDGEVAGVVVADASLTDVRSGRGGLGCVCKGTRAGGWAACATVLPQFSCGPGGAVVAAACRHSSCTGSAAAVDGSGS